MSRLQREFSPAGEASLSAAELLDLLGGTGGPQRPDLQEAIACYLSASEGWDEALKVLRGAFASDAAAAVRSGRSPQDKHEINQRASEYLQRHAFKPADSDND